MSEPLSVEKLVSSVNYAIDNSYVPTAYSLDFINFIKLVNGGTGEENKTPVLHYKMLDQMFSNAPYLANMVHRGAAKTTLLGEYLFLYIAFNGGKLPGFGSVEFALYVSDSVDNGVKNMRKNLQVRWENSDFLQKYVPDASFTDIEWRFKNIDGKPFIVKGYGAKTGVRGTKALGKRPKLAVLDDIVSDEDARSATIISTIEDTVHKAVTFALHPTQHKIVWSGTPFNASDPLYKAVESGAWAVNVYPVCEKFPCEKKEFRGSWPDRFTYEYVKTQYEKAVLQGKVSAFNQELMLRIMSDEDRLIADVDIRWYKRSTLLQNKDNFNFYITTDFATSEKQSADFSFISVWAVNNNGDWFWVDGICKRQLMDATIDDLFTMVSKYKPIEVGIEVTGQQGGFIPWIQKEMMSRNVWFTLAKNDKSESPGLRPNTNKLQRFNIVVPWFKQGKMYFPEDAKFSPAMSELMEELSLASVSGFKSKHDDGLDTISMLSLLKIWLPSDVTVSKANSGDVYEVSTGIISEDFVNNYIC